MPRTWEVMLSLAAVRVTAMTVVAQLPWQSAFAAAAAASAESTTAVTAMDCRGTSRRSTTATHWQLHPPFLLRLTPHWARWSQWRSEKDSFGDGRWPGMISFDFETQNRSLQKGWRAQWQGGDSGDNLPGWYLRIVKEHHCYGDGNGEISEIVIMV